MIIRRLREREREIGDRKFVIELDGCRYYQFLIVKKFRNEPLYKKWIVEDAKIDNWKYLRVI